jgi:hypothetical protein
VNCAAICATDLSTQVLLGTSTWVPACYDKLDTDNGDYAHDVLVKHIKGRLAREYRNAKVLLSVRAERGRIDPLPALCSVEAAQAAMDLTTDALSIRTLETLGLRKHVDAVDVAVISDSHAALPLLMRAELNLHKPYPSKAALYGLRARLDFEPANGRGIAFSWNLELGKAWLQRPLSMAQASGRVPREWLRYFNVLKNEYEDFRNSGIALTGFFDKMWETFPRQIEELETHDEYCKAWSWVLHTACDRFWGLFMNRIVDRQEDDRSPLVLLHGVKSEPSPASSKTNRRIPGTERTGGRLARPSEGGHWAPDWPQTERPAHRPFQAVELQQHFRTRLRTRAVTAIRNYRRLVKAWRSSRPGSGHS